MHFTVPHTLALPQPKNGESLPGTGPSNDELIERCKQLSMDCDVAINACVFSTSILTLFLYIFKHPMSSAESFKKQLEEISKKTWHNIATIIKKDLKKDQTLDQAFDELIATGRLSKEVLQVQSNFRLNIDMVP